jgi:hypothetical protein
MPWEYSEGETHVLVELLSFSILLHFPFIAEYSLGMLSPAPVMNARFPLFSLIVVLCEGLCLNADEQVVVDPAGDRSDPAGTTDVCPCFSCVPIKAC